MWCKQHLPFYCQYFAFFTIKVDRYMTVVKTYKMRGNMEGRRRVRHWAPCIFWARAQTAPVRNVTGPDAFYGRPMLVSSQEILNFFFYCTFNSVLNIISCRITKYTIYTEKQLGIRNFHRHTYIYNV